MIDIQVVLIAICLLVVAFLGALVAILSDSLIRIRKRVDFLEYCFKHDVINLVKVMIDEFNNRGD